MNLNLRNELQSFSDVQPTRDLWADALARVGSRERFRRPRRRPAGVHFPATVGVAAALAVIGVVAFGAVELTRSSVESSTKTPTQSPAGVPGPTVTQPLLSGTQVSMAQATKSFGSPIALPSTSAVQASDVGPIWMSDVAGGTTVAATFPSKGVWVSYDRAAQSDPASQVDPATHYKDMSTAIAGSDLVQLNGTTPAIYVPANDGSGVNAVDFEANGAEIEVYGPFGEKPLEAIAESILAQLSPAP